MATTLPANASKDNSDSVLDDPELALLTDLAGVIDKFNSLKSALGAAALYNIAEGLATAAQAGGTPDDLRTSIPMSGKSSAYTITTTDRSKLIRATGAGGFTLSFTAAATLGDGWYCFVRNDATSTVTLDPNGAETIDGATTRTLDAGQSVIVFCNGTLLVTGGPWNINSLENLTGGSPSTTVDADNDELLIYDASDGRHKKVNPSALGGGQLVLLETREITTTQSTIEFTEGIDGSCELHLFILSGLTVDTDERGIQVQLGTGVTPVWQTSGYSCALAANNASAGLLNLLGSALSAIDITHGRTSMSRGLGNSPSESMSGEVRLFNPASSSNRKRITCNTSWTEASSGLVSSAPGSGELNLATPVTALRFLLHDTGNFDGGHVSHYGFKFL